MKVGDLVRHNHPAWPPGFERIGVIVGMGDSWKGSRLNQLFKILWRDGTIGNNVWDYDLKIIKSS